MSTSDTDTFDANVCPCGRGKVVKHVTTQDNPWSSADISYSLECPECSGKGWGLETTGVWLVLRSSVAAADAANRAWMQVSEPLGQLVGRLVDSYFSKLAAKTKKAEFEEAVRLNIYTGNYRAFLRGKSEGKTTGQICYGLRNITLISSLAQADGSKPQLDSLVEERDRKRAEWESAAKAIIRWPVERRRVEDPE